MQQQGFGITKERFHLLDDTIYYIGGVWPEGYIPLVLLDEKEIEVSIWEYKRVPVVDSNKAVASRVGVVVKMELHLPKNWKEYRRLSVYALSAGHKINWYSVPVKKLADNNSGIQYFFDGITLDQEKGVCSARGWMVSTEDITVHVYDQNKRPLPFQIKHAYRDDVNKQFEELNQDMDAGFYMDIELKDAASVMVVFSTLHGQVTKVIPVSKVAKMQKKISGLGESIQSNLSSYGIGGLIHKVKAKVFMKNKNPYGYHEWMEVHKVSAKELKLQKKYEFAYRPLISIIIPLYNTPLNYLKDLIESLVNQSYGNIEICFADGSTDTKVQEFIWKNYKKDTRIRYQKLTENRGISENTNAALALATGDYIMLSDHDDVLERDAVFEIVKGINKNPQTVDVIYTDEDKVTMDGKRYFEPNMKPDFNLELLRNNNYICHIFVVRKEIMDQIGGFRSQFDGAQDYDLILRCCELAREIVHVPKVLYHWRSHPASTAENPESKLYAFEAGRNALQGHLDRMGIDGEASSTHILGRYRIRYTIKGNPKVSIIIPNKDHKEDLKKCLESIWKKTTYENYEILIVENNSVEPETFAYYQELQEKQDGLKIITWKDGFNYAAINNYAVKNCDGEYLLLLNNDTEVLTENWIEEMLGICQRPDVGAVGAKLYFPDNTVQHAGVVIGMGGIAGHIFSCMPKAEYGYQAKLISSQDYSAVTAACMMIKRAVFEQVEGFDERYRVAFNDIDLCMKIRHSGNRIIFTPHAELYHYESKSRGKEETREQLERFQGEVRLFEEKWPEILNEGDPFYSPNLSLKTGDCSLRWDE